MVDKPDDLVHLRDDHDNIGEPMPWCNSMSMRCEDRPENVTCVECLRFVAEFAADCAIRLTCLTTPVTPTQSAS